ncbi:MAG: hypothetical protein RIS76_2922, partial [Verrucomicrobiota bacterium]
MTLCLALLGLFSWIPLTVLNWIDGSVPTER